MLVPLDCFGRKLEINEGKKYEKEMKSSKEKIRFENSFLKKFIHARTEMKKKGLKLAECH